MNRHVLAISLVILLLAGMGPIAAAADEPAPTATIAPNTPEVEPNDTIDSASAIEWNWRTGTWRPVTGIIDPPGDVDFYSFSAGGLSVLSFQWAAWGSSLRGVLSLYDAAGELLNQATCVASAPCLEYTVPTPGGTFFLKVVDANGAGGADYSYRLVLSDLGPADPNEPNDTLDQATPVGYEVDIPAAVVPCNDVDVYTFVGRAGDELWVSYSSGGQLLDAEGNVVVEFSDDDWRDGHVLLPDDGVYYLRLVFPEEYCDGTYTLRIEYLDQPIYMSFNKGGRIQGIAFTSGDVLRYWTHSKQWEMYLDLSDIGLTGNLTALGRTPYSWNEEFLLGFAANYPLPAVGVVQPHDLVYFVPETTGEDTSGELSFRFDGSDIGLTVSGERIDALGYDDYDLTVSTTGRAKVPFGLEELTLEDEDLTLFNHWHWGVNTFGRWWGITFDGSSYGLGPADVVGTDNYYRYLEEYYDENGAVSWLSFDRPVVLAGIAFAPGDIVECFDRDVPDIGPDGICDTFSKLFDASDAGLGSLKIDAFEVGQLD